MKTPQNGQIKTVATGKNIPRFYQWDELWGYTVYSGTAFGLTGCCPTCLAMVYQGVTGNTDLSPYDLGEVAVLAPAARQVAAGAAQREAVRSGQEPV